MRNALLLLALAAGCGRSSSSSSSASADGARAFTYKPAHGSTISIVHRTADNLAHDPSGPRPDWVLYDPKGDQIVFVGSEAGYQRALKIAQAYDVAPDGQGLNPLLHADALVPDPYAPPPYPPDPFTAAVDAAVHVVDDQHYVIDRSLIDQVLANPMAVAKGARVVPSMKNGVANGFKLYAIRPSSVFAKIGLANGDTIHAVNGLDMSSADQALEIYTRLRTANSLDVDVTRRGTELTLHYSIK